jgi:hypothetical protein
MNILKLDTNMSIINKNWKYHVLTSVNRSSAFVKLFWSSFFDLPGPKYNFDLLINELHNIKNVNVTKDEFEERKKRDDALRANDFEWYDWDFDNNPLYYHIMDTPERYGDDKHATVPYNWNDGEVVWWMIYKDISIFYFYSNYWEKEEIYKTSEIIDFITKKIEVWKEVEKLNKKLDNK